MLNPVIFAISLVLVYVLSYSYYYRYPEGWSFRAKWYYYFLCLCPWVRREKLDKAHTQLKRLQDECLDLENQRDKLREAYLQEAALVELVRNSFRSEDDNSWGPGFLSKRLVLDSREYSRGKPKRLEVRAMINRDQFEFMTREQAEDVVSHQLLMRLADSLRPYIAIERRDVEYGPANVFGRYDASIHYTGTLVVIEPEKLPEPAWMGGRG